MGIIESRFNQISLTLNGEETSVTFKKSYRAFAVRNDGSGDITVCAVPGHVAGDSGTVTVSSGESVVYKPCAFLNEIYISGNGSVTVQAQDDFNNPFKSKSKGGDGSGKSGIIELYAITTDYTIGEITNTEE